MPRPDFAKCMAAIIVAFLCVATASGLRAEIALAPGDKVMLTVIGVRDLDTIATLDAEGFVNFPAIGRVAAEGLTVDWLKSDVARELSRQPLRLQTDGGESVWFKVEPSNVFLSLAEYRPIFVTGAVQIIGAQLFRPGLTTRQALVLAGGIGPGTGTTSEAEIGRMLAERRILLERLSAVETEVARLETDLAAIEADAARAESGDAAFSGQRAPDSSRQWLSAREELRELNEKAANLTLNQMEDRLNVLSQLEQVTSETLKTYEEEYDRARDLAKRGLVPANSVSEAQRGLLSFSSRALETTSEAYRVRTDIARAKEQTAATRAEARVDTLAELIRSGREARDIKVRIAALDMQMPMQAQGGTQVADMAISVQIFRATRSGETRIPADWDTLVAPGDVVEFTYLPPEIQ